jgi:hypothetical protein
MGYGLPVFVVASTMGANDLSMSLREVDSFDSFQFGRSAASLLGVSQKPLQFRLGYSALLKRQVYQPPTPRHLLVIAIDHDVADLSRMSDTSVYVLGGLGVATSLAAIILILIVAL